ncbi:MAG TPA: PQQ-binding-like beta-propeller repeat protein [Vicinamibacterales bacterium]|nr:PQQ-binding-like beta-propeller repeat protein [Vicinamibacterales bacterium]
MKYSLPLALLIATALVAQQPSSTDNGEALLDAARTGNRDRVVALLDSGVNVNTLSRYNVSALGFAAERGHMDVVRVLVERGADVNVTDWFYGSRPLDFALRGGHLEIALYLLERGSRGAANVLNTGIRRRNVAAVRAALATGQVDATALAGASALAKQTGDAAIVALVGDAAARTPAIAPAILELDDALLRSYQGRYQNATSGAAVTVSFDGERLLVTADGQSPLRLQPVEDRRFIADDTPEVTVTFAGRGGIVERLSIARANSSVRYEREGFGDATSPAPDPGAAMRTAAAPAVSAPTAAAAPRGKPLPWPAFRGANAAGVADGQGVVAEWDVATGKNVRWKTPVPGLATSSPVVWGDRVIVVTSASDQDTSFRTGLYGDVKPVDDLSIHSYRVYSLDRATGKVVWQREAFKGPPITKRHTKSSQANATPVTDGRRVVAVFGSIGLMVCYDMDGTLEWKKDIGVLDSGWFLDPSYQWGHSSSPIIYKSSVIVQADQARGSFIASFDLTDGRQLWRTARPDEVSTWATPTILSGPKGDEIVTNGTKVRGYDPATGALLWTLTPNSEIAIGTPVVHRDMAIITAGYPPVRPVYAVRAGARGDISLPPGRASSDAIAWSHDRDGTYISSPIVYRGQLYTLNNNGILTAYDADTGERLYRARVGGGGAFSASPIAADGKLYLASEDGDVFVVQAGREYVELARHAMNEVIMASPAISDGMLFIRTLGHLWAIGR